MLETQKPKIGVWICDCKGMISRRVDTARVSDAAAKLSGVALVQRAETLCKRGEMTAVGEQAQEAGVNRVLFAGCSARSSLRFPEEQLTGVLQELGVDKSFLEVANLREQCAWLHSDLDAATAKAIDQVRMAHARLRLAEASPGPVPIVPRSLVIGGGPAGLQAAKSLASAGQKVTLVEKGDYLGGRLCQIGFLFQSESWPAYCRSECVGPVQAVDAVLSPEIEVLTRSEVLGIDKMDGNFQARIKKGATFVNPEHCISCGECAAVCPEEAANSYEEGLYRRKAIDKDFERAVPDTFTIVDEACTRCGECVEICPTDAIDLEARPDLFEESFGAVFLGTGFEHYDVGQNEELSYHSDNVINGMELERVLDRGLRRPSDGEVPDRVVFLLCSGSRATLGKPGRGVPYCSKTCCATTVKQVERITARHPETEVLVVYYRDVRTYERAFESFYTRLKGMGVEFVDGEIDSITEEDGGSLRIRIDLGEGEEPDIDDGQLEDGNLAFDSDLVVLASAQVPRRSSLPLLGQLQVQTDRDGFPMENQVRLFRPTESLVDRVYAVGASVGPKVVQQAVEQGVVGAMKALPVLARGEKEIGKFSSRIDPALCIRCSTCIAVCPHGAIRMTPEGAVSDPAFCQACGFCAAACPTHAAQLVNFSDEQMLAQVDVAFQELPDGEPRILALLCYWCAYGGGDMAGVKRLEAPANFRSIRIRCSSSVSSGLLLEMYRKGVDGILVGGCPDRSCHHLWGNYLSDRRIALLKRYFSEMGLSERRLRFEYIGVPQSKKFVDTLELMDRDLRALGPNPIPNLGRA